MGTLAVVVGVTAEVEALVAEVNIYFRPPLNRAIMRRHILVFNPSVFCSSLGYGSGGGGSSGGGSRGSFGSGDGYNGFGDGKHHNDTASPWVRVDFGGNRATDLNINGFLHLSNS